MSSFVKFERTIKTSMVLNGIGMKMEWKIFNRNYQGKIECNWNGNGMENFEQKYSMRNGMERGWKWNVNKHKTWRARSWTENQG